MQRTRQIAASPVRSASDAWAVVKQLIADTLERSSQVPDGSVKPSLTSVDGLLPALIAGGHLVDTPLVLVDGDLYVSIHVVRGDNAFTLQENLSPVPGGASATTGWRLYISPPAHIVDAVEHVCESHVHLVCGKAPAPSEQKEAASRAAESASAATAIDVDALRRLEGNG